MDLRRVKEKATEAFSKGRFSKAATLYAEYCSLDPKDRQARMRLGDAWARAGEKSKAIEAYRTAAEAFAKDGFLPRAIAASKLILELDPSHQGVQQMLADLYSEKSASPRRTTSSTLVPPRMVPLTAEGASAPAKAMASTALTGEAAVIVPAPVSTEPAPTPAAAESPPEPEISEREQSAPHAASWAPPQEGSSPKVLDLSAEMDSESDLGSLDKTADRLTAFTELDLDGESFLQAVDAAARSGMAKRAAQPEARPAPIQPGAPIPADAIPSVPKIPLFSDLPPEAFIELFVKCPLHRCSLGQAIITQGEIGDSFFVVCSGSVRVFRVEQGAPRDIAKLEEGAFFGEMALLSGEPRAASVESASEDTELLEIPARLLAELSHRHPGVAWALRNFYRHRLLANVMDVSPLFRPFGKADRNALVQRFKGRDVPAQELIISEGVPADALYVVLSGEVEVRKADQIALARLKEGDIFGEMSLLTRKPATASVVTVKPTSLLYLPRQDFEVVISSHPQILALVAELTDERAKKTRSLLSSVPSGTFPLF